MYSKTTHLGTTVIGEVSEEALAKIEQQPKWDREMLQLYFEEHLGEYSLDEIESLLLVVELEKGFGEQALIHKDKKRFRKKHLDALDDMEKDLVRSIGTQVCLDTNILDAIELLRTHVDTVLHTRLDIKNEIEEDLAEDMKNPLFVKLLKNARNFIRQ